MRFVVRRKHWLFGATASLLAAALLAWQTFANLAPLPASLEVGTWEAPTLRVLAADGTVLNRSYAGAWNHHDNVPLVRIPIRLREAVVAAEDKRFFQHSGADWLARAHALWQNATAGKRLRGASTISEQVVRMIHPRPRTIWSRWLEGFDAARLEQRFGKLAILNFYLNQVPYARNRRGIVQAARLYFDRTPDTLSPHEMMTLAVLIRAPGRFDLYGNPNGVQARVGQLAENLRAEGQVSENTVRRVKHSLLSLRRPELDLDAPHFVSHVKAEVESTMREQRQLRTTMDASLQQHTQKLLATRIEQLADRGVCDGAVVVAEHRTGAIKAWVSASPACGRKHQNINAVLVPRQPGSTLKPFIYAMAIENGWHASTLIEDAPLAEMVGKGLHAYRNYSRVHYGHVTLREALGNSLNIPSVKALQFVGADKVLARLRLLGILELDGHPNVYGDGLALGNGEVDLLSVVQAYAVLANRGQMKALHVDHSQSTQAATHKVFDARVSSLIANILADETARALEFGQGGVLNLPIETAVKTGTSSNHRDAWAIGFDDRYVVGVWLGNLDGTAMRKVSGASGPAQVMRSVFAFLNRDGKGQKLYLSPHLRQATTCARPDGRGGCQHTYEEWFVSDETTGKRVAADRPMLAPRVRRPTPGLHLALDPRIPASMQGFRLALERHTTTRKVEWFVNGERLNGPQLDNFDQLWPLIRGRHVVSAKVWRQGSNVSLDTAPVEFEVR